MRLAPSVVACVVVTSAGGLLGGCVARNAWGDVSPQMKVVERLEADLERGDLAAAHQLVDVDYRLAEMLGDFYTAGPEADRTDLVAQTYEMFDRTTEQRWGSCCKGREMRRRVKKVAGDDLWIVSEPSGPGAPKFTWEYRLSLRGGEWRITQRELRADGTRSDSTRFWPMARRKITEQFGRAPTLAEFNANLPSMQGLLRKRSYVVGSHGR